MSYRFFNPAPVLADLLGLSPCAGGSLTFCDLGTTTPKGTWSDAEMAVPNSNPVLLDSAGRSNTNIWLDGGYTVTLRDAAGVVVWTRDINSGQGAGAALPAMEAGKFLTTDGSNWLLQAILQVPDPSGASGYQLGTDGANLIWEPKPATPESPVVTTDNSFKVNGILDQWGAASIPASGSRVASVSITFPVAYIAVPNVVATIARSSGSVSAGFIGSLGVVATLTGATIFWDLDYVGSGAGFNLTSPIPITWRAVGKVSS